MERIKYLKKRITETKSYIKHYPIKYWYNHIYWETPYIDMPYEIRINNKRYNLLVENMDRYATEIKEITC